jgi:hypothetical protein
MRDCPLGKQLSKLAYSGTIEHRIPRDASGVSFKPLMEPEMLGGRDLKGDNPALDLAQEVRSFARIGHSVSKSPLLPWNPALKCFR